MKIEAIAPWRPTRHETLLALTRELAGPYPGPNRVVLAVLLAENLLNLVERDGGAWWQAGALGCETRQPKPEYL